MQTDIIKNLEKIKIRINEEKDLSFLLKDESFVAYIDNIFPTLDILKRSLLSADRYFNKNQNFAIQTNELITQINSITSKYNKIILYGNGNITKLYKPLFGDKIVAIIDKQIYDDSILPNQINSYEYDCIIIMVLGREKEIINSLTSHYKVNKNKIFEFNFK